ncbi:MAG: ADP-ribosylglycohydrolase [Clostridia bacterium]|nr:ADP-ribosylglycohydrolase [Clostridia bacterium]
MLGAITGDIVGSRFEFNNYRRKDFELFAAGCQVTDDSIMTLAVVKALMEAAKLESLGDYSLVEQLAVKYMQEIGRKYPSCGYGGMFEEWVFSDEPKPYNSFGNGAAMRISPVGFMAGTETEVIQLSKAVTGVTHNHPEGIKGAEAVAVVVFMARQGCTKDEIRDQIDRFYYPLDFTIDGIRDTYEFNETCQETVPQAIQAFLESVSFEDAIRTAVSVGGDSDTLAAITGAVAEAYYGIPEDIKIKALIYLDDELRAIYDRWISFHAGYFTP